MHKITQSQLELYFNSLGQSVHIPVLQVQSEIAGPHTILTALNHGDEVIGLEAGLNIIKNTTANPDFKGKLTLLTALNIAGFQQVERIFAAENFNSNSYFNLNRAYNQPRQNLTSFVAGKIFKYITDQEPDFAVDLHSYSQNSLIHLILDRPGGDLEKQMIQKATRSQMPFYLEYEALTVSQQMLDFSLSNQLCLQNICAFTLELGPKRGFSKIQSQIATQALSNLLNTFEHFDDENLEIYPDLKFSDKFLYNRLGVENNSEFSGFYRPLVDIGQEIVAEQAIAQIVDLAGNVVFTVQSPANGLIIAFEEEAMIYPKRQFATMITKLKA